MEEKQLVQEVALPIYESRGWIKFQGIVMLVLGILYALTIVGIIIAWLPIWQGVLLMKAAGAIEGAQINGDKRLMVESLSKVKTFFVINGVLMLVALIALVVAMLIMGGTLLAMLSQMCT